MRLESLQFVMQFCFTNFVYLIKTILCFLLTVCLVVNVTNAVFGFLFFFLVGFFFSAKGNFHLIFLYHFFNKSLSTHGIKR